MSVTIIVAMTTDRVIGKNNQMPWHLPEDLKRFKALTMGHPLIMGRKTYDSIGKPLPGRPNIVLSTSQNFNPEGVTVADSLQKALQLYPNEENFIIGGAQIYKQALTVADKILVTLIHKKYEGDVFFPDIDFKKCFNSIDESPVHKSKNGGVPYQYLSFVRFPS